MNLDPERWLKVKTKQKRAFIPFGSGQNLSQGRDFAFVEIWGLWLSCWALRLGVFDGEFLRIPGGKMAQYRVVGLDEDGRR